MSCNTSMENGINDNDKTKNAIAPTWLPLQSHKDWNKLYNESNAKMHAIKSQQSKQRKIQRIKALETIILRNYFILETPKQSELFEPLLIDIVIKYLVIQSIFPSVSPINPGYKCRGLGKHFLKIRITTAEFVNTRCERKYLSIDLRKIVEDDGDTDMDKHRFITMTWKRFSHFWGIPKYETQGGQGFCDRSFGYSYINDHDGSGDDGERSDALIAEMIIAIIADTDNELTFAGFIKDPDPMTPDGYKYYVTACSLDIEVNDEDEFALSFDGKGLEVELVKDLREYKLRKEIYKFGEAQNNASN